MLKRFCHFLSTNHKDIALIAILFLLPLACFADVILLPYTFYQLDLELAQYPGKIFLTELMLKEGQLGLWNPYIFMGFPLLAEPEVGPLYPFNLLFALPIPHYYALTLFIVIHYSLAGVFTYLLARSLDISRAGSFISGLVFAFGGFLMAQLRNISILTGCIWLPLILCLFSQAIRRRSYTFAAGAGIVLALQILPSHPQIILYILIVLGLYYLYSLLTLPRAEIRPVLTLSLISLTTVVVGMSLAATQLIPAWLLKELSTLSEGGTYDFVTAYSLPPLRMLSFLFPNFLGNPVIGYKGEPFFAEHHAYAGILPLILAALAWGKRRNREARFFGLLALVSILLALGNATPIYRLLAYVPVYNYFRIPARWLYTLTLSLGILAGFGLDYLTEQREDRSMRILSRGLIILGLLFTLTLRGPLDAHLVPRADHSRPPVHPHPAAPLLLQETGHGRYRLYPGARLLGDGHLRCAGLDPLSAPIPRRRPDQPAGAAFPSPPESHPFLPADVQHQHALDLFLSAEKNPYLLVSGHRS